MGVKEAEAGTKRAFYWPVREPPTGPRVGANLTINVGKNRWHCGPPNPSPLPPCLPPPSLSLSLSASLAGLLADRAGETRPFPEGSQATGLRQSYAAATNLIG